MSNPPLRVAFRVDAAPAMGTGHLMRCLTLADALRDLGADIRFLLAAGAAPWAGLPAARGHAVTLLPPAPPAAEPDHLPGSVWLPWGWCADAAATRAALPDRVDWLVVDHYGLDARWEQSLRPAARRILALDDAADRPHACDVLLDGNLQDAGRYTSLVPAAAERLIGPRFALLRPEFAAARRLRDGGLRQLLVFMSGTDAAGATLAALAAIDRAGLRAVPLTVLAGGANPHLAAIRGDLASRPAAALHVDTPDVVPLAAAADLAIGAGGMAALERCCLGLPTLTVVLADNQTAGVAHLAAAGAVARAPDWQGDGNDAKRLAPFLASLAADSAARQAMSAAALRITDGKGTRRVVVALLRHSWPLALRRATPEDAALLHRWRNHPEIRAVSFDGAEIAWNTHTAWLARILADPACRVWIGRLGSVPVGTLRSRRDGTAATLSIAMDPDLRGLRLGAALLRAGIAALAAEPDPPAVLHAEVRAENAASCALFAAAGFRPVFPGADPVLYARDLHPAARDIAPC